MTIREIVEEVDISTFLPHSILTEDLAMKRVVAKFVPNSSDLIQTFLAKIQTPVDP